MLCNITAVVVRGRERFNCERGASNRELRQTDRRQTPANRMGAADKLLLQQYVAYLNTKRGGCVWWSGQRQQCSVCKLVILWFNHRRSMISKRAL